VKAATMSRWSCPFSCIPIPIPIPVPLPCRFVFKTNFQNQYLPKVFCIPNNLAKQLARQPESKSGGRGKSIEFVVATAAKQIVNK